MTGLDAGAAPDGWQDVDKAGQSDISALLAQAESLAEAREWRTMHQICLEVLSRAPQNGRALFLLGVLAAEHDNPAKAEALFARATVAEPSLARAHIQRARMLLTLSRREEALAAAGQGLALAPTDAHSLDTLGVVFTRLGLHSRAAPFYEQAAALQPANAAIAYNLAAARQFTGDFAGAAEAYSRTLALDPGHYKAALALVQLARQTPEANRVTELEAMFRADDEDAALHVGHALAKSLEDLGQYLESFAWLTRAKAAKARRLNHDPAIDTALFEAAARHAPRAGSGFDSDAPIFVVGLPRTGTTLVDRILSSHPEVTSAGELTNFALIAKRMTGTASNLVLDAPTLAAAANLDFPALGRAYIDSVRPLVPAGRFVDKMPLNIYYAGLIHRALPNARIVCLRRDPMDAVLSNYRQLFATGFSYYDYAYDLEHTARYYTGFDRLAAHWRASLPADRFTEIHYEALVSDQEAETRRLLQVCGLSWDARCLSFQDNAAPVATASSVQVRQPLYATSIGRWRRYGEALGPALRVLAEAGVGPHSQVD